MARIVEIFISYIILRGVVAPFVTTLFKKYFIKPLIAYLKTHFVRTERELAIWLHYKNKALNVGHHHRQLKKCEDGLCKLV